MRAKMFKCRFPILMASVIAPVVLLTGAFQADNSPWLWMLFVALYAVFGCVCMFIPGKWRLPAGLIGCAAQIAAGWYYLPWREAWPLWMIPVGCSVLLLFTLPMGAWERGHELNPAWPITGLLIHLIAQMLMNLQMARREVFDALYLPVFLSFLIYLVFSLMMQNRISLLGAMPDAAGVPLSIRRRNKILVWITLSLTLLLSLIPAFAKALQWLWVKVKEIVIAFVRWLMSLTKSDMPVGGGGETGDAGMPLMEAGEPSLFAMIMEKIMLVVAGTLAILLTVWVLRFLWKKLKKLAVWLMQRLRSYAQSASEDYVDELEDTRSQGEERFAFARDWFKKHLSERDLKGLPPREQIRKRYGILRRRHPEWTDSQTARDTLNEAPAELYERARYSSHEITEADAETFLKS